MAQKRKINYYYARNADRKSVKDVVILGEEYAVQQRLLFCSKSLKVNRTCFVPRRQVQKLKEPVVKEALYSAIEKMDREGSAEGDIEGMWQPKQGSADCT